KKETAAVEAYKRLQSAETDPIEKLRNEARYFYMRFYHLADLNALSALEKLSENADAKHEAYYFLGLLYQDTDADKAIINFEKAAAAANSEMERATAVIGAARSIYQLDQQRGFLRIIQQIAQTKD